MMQTCSYESDRAELCDNDSTIQLVQICATCIAIECVLLRNNNQLNENKTMAT